MTIHAKQLSPLIQLSSQLPSAGYICFQPQHDHHYEIEAKAASIWQRSFNQEEAHATLNHLKTLIGAGRFERIIQRKSLGLSPACFPLTQAILKKIFLALGDIQLDDLQEAAQIEGRELKDYTVSEMDALYRSLIPLDTIEDVFFRSLPQIDYYDKIHISGRGYLGMLQERVWTILHLWRMIVEEEHEPLRQAMTEIEVLTSRLGDREPPQGTVIRLQKGYFVVDKIFSAGGCYASILREVTNTAPPILLCRGTGVPLLATGGLLSCINDVLPEIGTLGIQNIWNDVSSYLEENQISEITVMGKSLGGAHAQYLAALITGKTKARVSSLITNCSVGVPEMVQGLFQQALAASQKEEPAVWIVRNSGKDENGEIDYIPFVGGVHLHTAKTRAYYLIPAESQDEASAGLPTHHWTLKKILKFIFSFPFAHIRQTTLKDYHFKEETNIYEEVRKGHQLEWLRQFVARILYKLTRGHLYHSSFETFYHS